GLAVDEVAQRVAAGDDAVVVPLGEGGGGAFERAGDLRLVGEFDDLAAFAGDAAASLLVEHAEVFRLGVEVHLVAADGPGGGVEDAAAVLDAGVVVAGDAGLELELE